MYKTNTYLQKIFLILIIGLSSLVPLFIWPFNQDYYYYPKVVMIYILVIIALFLLTFYIKHIKLRFTKELLPMILFISLVLLSAILSKYKFQAFNGAYLRYEGAFAYICYFFILYLSYNFIDSSRHMDSIIIFIMASAFVISLYALLQYVGIEILPRDYIRKSWTFTSFATLGNPNFLGSYLSMVLPAAVCLYYREKRKTTTVILFFLNIIFYSSLVCTMTRSAWIGAAFTIIVLFIVFFKETKKYVKKTLPLIGACFLMTFLLNNYHGGLIREKFKTIGDDYKKVVSNDKSILSAGSQRLFIWARTVEYLFDRPFLGSGPDTFDRVFEMSTEEAVLYFGSDDIYVDKAHNEYLQMIVTLGFPASALYLFFLIRILFRSGKVILSKQYNIYVLCFSSGILSYIIQAFFNISVVSVAPLFWSMLGLLLASHDLNGGKAQLT